MNYSPSALSPTGSVANTSGINSDTQTALNAKASVRVIQTTDFTAAVNGRYTVFGTATVTDPTGTVAGQIYSVICASGSATMGGVAYLPSRVEIVRAYNGTAWTTLTPQFSDSLTLSGTNNTAANQTLTGAGSILTQGLADVRYGGQGGPGTIYEARLMTDSAYVLGTTYVSTTLTLTLPPGLYYWDSYGITKGTDYAAGGSKLTRIATGTYSWVGVRTRGTTTAYQTNNGTLSEVANQIQFTQQDDTQNLSKNVTIEWEGYLTVSSTTMVTFQVAQYVASGTTGVCLSAGSYMRARKL